MSDKELTSEWVTRSWEGCGGVSWGDEVADKWPKIVPILRACSGLDLPADVKEGAVKQLVEAVKAIEDSPFGCVFCDSGKLRNPAKEHDYGCGFSMMRAALRDLGVKP